LLFVLYLLRHAEAVIYLFEFPFSNGTSAVRLVFFMELTLKNGESS